MALRLAPGLVLLVLAPSAFGADPTLTLDLGDGVRMELVLVKKGPFLQGSPVTEKGRNDDEAPRQVTLTRDFYLGRYPVTRGQFAQFIRQSGYRTEAERGSSGGFGWDGTRLVQKKEYTWRNPGFEQTDDHPVVLVTYGDAQSFCNWLAGRAGREVALPTEAQWEYACRAGSRTRFFYGDDEAKLGDFAWYKANAGNGTRRVGQKKANAWGLDDMSGHVWEWCRDWYAPYAAGPVNDPEQTREPPAPARRILRGGSWLREAKDCRSAARYRNTPGSRNADNGFRVGAAIEARSDKSDPEEAEAGVEPVPPPTLAQVDTGGSGPPVWWSLLSCGCCGGFVVLLAGGAYFLLRRSQSPPSDILVTGRPVRATRREGPRIRPGDDGFWVELPDVESGSEVRYRCVVDGQEQTASFTWEPGPEGQFIYTGGRPSDVEIIEIIGPGGAFTPRPPLPPSAPRAIGPRPSPPPRPLIDPFPPAY